MTALSQDTADAGFNGEGRGLGKVVNGGRKHNERAFVDEHVKWRRKGPEWFLDDDEDNEDDKDAVGQVEEKEDDEGQDEQEKEEDDEEEESDQSARVARKSNSSGRARRANENEEDDDDEEDDTAEDDDDEEVGIEDDDGDEEYQPNTRKGKAAKKKAVKGKRAQATGPPQARMKYPKLVPWHGFDFSGKKQRGGSQKTGTGATPATGFTGTPAEISAQLTQAYMADLTPQQQEDPHIKDFYMRAAEQERSVLAKWNLAPGVPIKLEEDEETWGTPALEDNDSPEVIVKLEDMET